MDKKVGVVLINYKDYANRFLPACRDSLRAQSYPANLVRIYIVDNASTEGTLEYLKSSYPEASIIPRPDGNYAAANNAGFRKAIEDGCEYLVTANMDTEMDQAWLEELVRGLDDNPEAGIIQSKILLYPRTEEEKRNPRINSLGNIIHFLGFGFTSGYGQLDRMIEGYPEIRGYASGCSFIIRKETFDKIGGYDEGFYMYHDDLEVSLKAKLSGYKILLAPKSVIFHKYEFSRSVQMLYYMERNRYLTILLFYPASLIWLVALPLIMMDLGMALYSLLGGWFKTELRIMGYFFQPENLRHISVLRREINKRKAVPISSLAKDWAGKIEFQEIANPILTYVVNPLFDFYWRLVKKIL